MPGRGAPPRLRPSGAQYEIYYGDQVAVVTEVGATLRSYSVGDWEVLDGFGDGEAASAGRGQVLAPWPNRLRDGNYVFEGVACQAPLDEIENRNAIHGLVRWANWTETWRAQNRLRMEHILYPQPGYRWLLGLAVTFSLSHDGLAVEFEVENRGEGVLPFGIGFHPYLSCDGGSIDSTVLTVPASSVLTTDERQIPTGTSAVDGTLMDFRKGAPLGGEVGPVRLDTCFTDLSRDDQGFATVILADQVAGREVSLWADGAFSCFMVYTGDSLPDMARRRQGVAVEPMTCWPNAFQSGRGVVRLEPGAHFSARWGIQSQSIST